MLKPPGKNIIGPVVTDSLWNQQGTMKHILKKQMEEGHNQQSKSATPDAGADMLSHLPNHGMSTLSTTITDLSFL